MATVTQIADYVCGATGLSTTANSSERNMVLRFLDDANAQAVDDSSCYAGTFSKSLTSGTARYTIGTSPLDVTDILRLRTLTVSDSGGTSRPLIAVTEDDLRAMKHSSTTTGHVTYYTMLAPNIIEFYPTPGDSTTLDGTYVASPLALVESGAVSGTSETTPSSMPARFHYDVIGNLGIALALEWDNRFEDAGYYRNLYAAGIAKLNAWVNRFDGNIGADTTLLQRGASNWPDTY